MSSGFSRAFRQSSPCLYDGLSSDKAYEIPIELLACDYDGTLAPLGVARSKSKVQPEVQEALQKIRKLVPIAIITTKDLQFVKERTLFANAWVAVSGLETKIGNSIQREKVSEDNLEALSLGINYARAVVGDGVEIEEKRDSSHRLIGMCLDWRRARSAASVTQADRVKEYCLKLGLKIESCESLPFFDVYPVETDKGKALRKISKELEIERGILYLGDTPRDNPAFEVSDFGVGVINDGDSTETLFCDGVIDFEDVAFFLNSLLDNHLIFNLELLPMIRKKNREGDCRA